jgi:hypothetical protein
MSSRALRTSIVVLTIYAALIHLVVLGGVLHPSPRLGILFAFNGLGYLALLAALFVPLPWLQRHRAGLHMIFIAYATLTILAWVVDGTRDLLGYTTQLVQLVLIIALWAHMRS